MFYERFIELCEVCGIKPSVVAKEIGLSNSVITYWKRGSIPNANTVQKVSNYFHVPVAYFYDETPIPPVDIEEVRKVIMEGVQKMSDDQLTEFMKFFEMILSKTKNSCQQKEKAPDEDPKP